MGGGGGGGRDGGGEMRRGEKVEKKGNVMGAEVSE